MTSIKGWRQQAPSTAYWSMMPDSARALALIQSADRKHLLALLATVVLAAAIWSGASTLSVDGRIALVVLAAAVVGWAMTDISDSVVGLLAVAVLGASGVLDRSALLGSLGHEFIWLLVSALMIAAVLRKSGVVDNLVGRATRRVATVRSLFLVLTLVIAATAFVIPSTSARAALFLPIYISLADRIEDRNLRRALALLFPTAILLSASGSLIGAGAHVVAADFIARSTGARVDFIGWALTAMPFALGTSLIASELILRLFAPGAGDRALAFAPTEHPAALPSTHRKLAMVVLATVALWMTTGLHGVDIAIVGIGGIAVILLLGLSPMKVKETFRAVDLELIIFLAVTFAMIEAISRHGVDKWLASALLDLLPTGAHGNTFVVAVFVALVALVSHLIITSRSARAGVLIPTLAMPLAAMGHDATLLIMITILGTGFCQTLPASAKPVALFANGEHAAFSNADLIRLSLHLLPIMLVTLVAYGLVMWG